jgi:feruloyl-CoA synthase
LIREAFVERLTKFLAQATGSSTRITRAVLLGEPLSIDMGEVTDKGSVNQRAVLEHRAHLIEDLYADHPPAHVIAVE